MGLEYRKSGKIKVKAWAWLEAGCKAIEGIKQQFGNPQPGDPFTDKHMMILMNFGPQSHEKLAKDLFIEEVKDAAALEDADQNMALLAQKNSWERLEDNAAAMGN